MRMKCRVVASLLLGTLVVLTSCSNNTPSSTTAPSGTGFMWVAAQGNNTLSAYTLDLANGAPNQNGSAIDGGLAPSALAISPDGTTLFLASKGADQSGTYDISTYTVASDGSVTSGSTTALNPAAMEPTALAIDPTGKILFVANQGSDNISVLSVNGTTLTELAGSPFSDVDPLNPVAAGPTSLALTPTGNFLYVANQFSNTIAAFQYDNTGVLTNLSPFTYPAGTNPTGLALSRTIQVNSQSTEAHFLYAANSGSNNVSGYAVCDVVSPNCLTPTGQLTEIVSAGSPFQAGISPVSIAVSPVFNGVYVVDQGSNEISMYKWSGKTGTLTPLSPAAVSTGSSPTMAQVHPDGDWLYVTNNGSTSVSIYSVGVTGPLLGPISSGPYLLQPQPSALVLR
jgi:6-phosphogluconolactonase